MCLYHLLCVHLWLFYRKGIVIQDAVEEFRGQLAKLLDKKGLVSEEKGCLFDTMTYEWMV